jgi:hypothetical protein
MPLQLIILDSQLYLQQLDLYRDRSKDVFMPDLNRDNETPLMEFCQRQFESIHPSQHEDAARFLLRCGLLRRFSSRHGNLVQKILEKQNQNLQSWFPVFEISPSGFVRSPRVDYLLVSGLRNDKVLLVNGQQTVLQFNMYIQNLVEWRDFSLKSTWSILRQDFHKSHDLVTYETPLDRFHLIAKSPESRLCIEFPVVVFKAGQYIDLHFKMLWDVALDPATISSDSRLQLRVEIVRNAELGPSPRNYNERFLLPIEFQNTPTHFKHPVLSCKFRCLHLFFSWRFVVSPHIEVDFGKVAQLQKSGAFPSFHLAMNPALSYVRHFYVPQLNDLGKRLYCPSVNVTLPVILYKAVTGNDGKLTPRPFMSVMVPFQYDPTVNLIHSIVSGKDLAEKLYNNGNGHGNAERRSRGQRQHRSNEEYEEQLENVINWTADIYFFAISPRRHDGIDGDSISVCLTT